MSITGDQSLLKQINRMALVRVIQRIPGLSRADLAKETGLTKSTVSLLVQELIDEGWLLEREAQITGSIGRRPTPLCIDDSRLTVVGADLGVDRLSAVAVSLTGEVLHVVTEPFEGLGEERVLRRLAELIASCVQHVNGAGRTLLGVGVGVPGAVDERQGVLRVAPNLGWRDVSVVARLKEELQRAGVNDVKLYVQNEADVAALGEYEFGEVPVPEPLVFFSLGIGVGAGIIANDRLFLGAEGFAGEIGHSILQVDGPLCSCGRFGCAEAFIGLRAIGTQITGQRNALQVSRLVTLLEQKDEATHVAVSRAGHYLGVLIHNIWTAVNPGRVVLGGPTCDLGAPFLDAAVSCMEQYVGDAGLTMPEIRRSRYAQLSVAVGGGALVLHKLLRPLETRVGFPVG